MVVYVTLVSGMGAIRRIIGDDVNPSRAAQRRRDSHALFTSRLGPLCETSNTMVPARTPAIPSLSKPFVD